MGTDAEWKQNLRKITDPVEMLREVQQANEDGFLGGDPYYSDILQALMQQVDVVIELNEKKAKT